MYGKMEHRENNGCDYLSVPYSKKNPKMFHGSPDHIAAFVNLFEYLLYCHTKDTLVHTSNNF